MSVSGLLDDAFYNLLYIDKEQLDFGASKALETTHNAFSDWDRLFHNTFATANSPVYPRLWIPTGISYGNKEGFTGSLNDSYLSFFYMEVVSPHSEVGVSIRVITSSSCKVGEIRIHLSMYSNPHWCPILNVHVSVLTLCTFWSLTRSHKSCSTGLLLWKAKWLSQLPIITEGSILLLHHCGWALSGSSLTWCSEDGFKGSDLTVWTRRTLALATTILKTMMNDTFVYRRGQTSTYHRQPKVAISYLSVPCIVYR